MESVEQIKKLKTYYFGTLYGKVREEQRIDEEYRTDTFLVPEVKDPHKIYRSGRGPRMVDRPAEQLVTSNPQAFIEVRKGDKEAGIRIAREINEIWIPDIRRQNPNPPKETVKNCGVRGESYIQLAHNETWVKRLRDKKGEELRDKEGNLQFARVGLPIHFVIPDPMVVYGSPEEGENGIPERVIVFYERQPSDVILRYGWSNPKKRGEGNDKSMAEWFEYWDKNTCHLEADGEVVYRNKSIYGFTPFMRKYSGFGRRSPDGELSQLIVGDLRYARDLIREECAIRSDIASKMHIFAHQPILIKVPPGTTYDKEQLEKQLNLGAYGMGVLELPPSSEIIDLDYQLPSGEAFQHLKDIQADINQFSPFIMAGFPQGSSGRQDDLALKGALKRYETVVENTELQWATAFEKAFEIMRKIPSFPKLTHTHRADFDVDFRCTVKLKASDPVEEDRLATLGDRLWAQGQGSIDLRTNLIQYQGKTAEQAEDIITDILVDKVTLFDPQWAAAMGMTAAKEAGMEMAIQEMEQQAMEQQAQEKGLQEMPPPSTMERIKGEAQAPVSEQELDMALENRGARNPPARYTRS